MSFSTQKDFFYVPFMNESVQFECRKACVKLKSYNSSIDDRSWAMDDTQQSRFLSDLVTCNTPIAGLRPSEGGDGFPRGPTSGPGGAGGPDGGASGSGGGSGPGGGAGAGRGFGPGGRSGPGGGARSGFGPGGAGTSGGGFGPGGGAASDGLGTDGRDNFLTKGLVGADSVIECANKHLCQLELVLAQKKHLEQELEVSNERLKTANLENEKIKSLMNEKYDSSHSKDFYNKIQQLSSANKISKAEETELLQIYNKVEDMSRAYEVVKAENAYLKRLLEKLSLRATMDSIKLEPETSTDIAYLQNQVNLLRKEVSLLRKIEDDTLRAKGDNRQISDQDAQNLKAIIKERNTLREKCKTFDKLEKKVLELQKKAKEADHMSDSLTSNLDNQTKYIGDMEQEMRCMQNYYEDQLNKTKFSDEILKCQLAEMKEDLIRAKCEAQKVESLQMEIGCLRNELMRRDVALSDYDCQYKQLMPGDDGDSTLVNEIFASEMRIPDAVYFCSIETPSLATQNAMEAALKQLQREDPSLRVSYDEMTGQTALGGMGELHMDIVKSRILDVDLGPLQIAYKETIENPFMSNLTVEKEIAGSKQSVAITMELLREQPDVFSLDKSGENATNLNALFD